MMRFIGECLLLAAIGVVIFIAAAGMYEAAWPGGSRVDQLPGIGLVLLAMAAWFFFVLWLAKRHP